MLRLTGFPSPGSRHCTFSIHSGNGCGFRSMAEYAGASGWSGSASAALGRGTGIACYAVFSRKVA